MRREPNPRRTTEVVVRCRQTGQRRTLVSREPSAHRLAPLDEVRRIVRTVRTVRAHEVSGVA